MITIHVQTFTSHHNVISKYTIPRNYCGDFVISHKVGNVINPEPANDCYRVVVDFY